MFEIGDKVLYTGINKDDLKEGTVYTVCDVGINCIYLQSKKAYKAGMFHKVNVKDCVLYVEPNIDFKVGKKYIVKATNYHKFKDGEIVTCIAEENSNIPLFESEDSIQFVRATDIKGEYTEIKAGDIVKLRDDYKNSLRFKFLEEHDKHEISKNEGKVWEVDGIRINNPYNTPCAENRTARGTDYSDWCAFIIPIEFLEKVSDKRIFNKYEVIQAELLLGHMISELPNETKIKFVRNQRTIRVFKNNRLAGVVDCEFQDEFVESIGKMIALCKATGTEIPKWVYGER